MPPELSARRRTAPSAAKPASQAMAQGAGRCRKLCGVAQHAHVRVVRVTERLGLGVGSRGYGLIAIGRIRRQFVQPVLAPVSRGRHDRQRWASISRWRRFRLISHVPAHASLLAAALQPPPAAGRSTLPRPRTRQVLPASPMRRSSRCSPRSAPASSGPGPTSRPTLAVTFANGRRAAILFGSCFENDVCRAISIQAVWNAPAGDGAAQLGAAIAAFNQRYAFSRATSSPPTGGRRCSVTSPPITASSAAISR